MGEMNAKERVLSYIKNLPDDISLEEIVIHLNDREKILQNKLKIKKSTIKKTQGKEEHLQKKELEKKAEETLIDAINGKWEYQPEKKNISDLWQDFRCDLKYLLMPRNIKNEAERLLPEYTKYASIILNELPKKGK